MIFQLVDGKPVPACPWRWERHVEVPDGRGLYSLHDAATIAGGTAKATNDLAIRWWLMWGSILEPDDHRSVSEASDRSYDLVTGAGGGKC
jgi:hypothetical protein